MEIKARLGGNVCRRQPPHLPRAPAQVSSQSEPKGRESWNPTFAQRTRKDGARSVGSANASEPLLDFFHGQEGSVVVAGRVDGAGLDSGKGVAEFGEL